MDKKEFSIGQVFYTESGKWRCTDIGSRVIVAIQLNQQNPENYAGPPYSIAEYVFDEYDISACSLNATELEDNYEEIFNNKKFGEIYDGLMFVSSADYGEVSALLNKKTCKIYIQSEFSGIDEQQDLSEDEVNSTDYIEIPHKNDLDLGRNLVFDFVEQFMPDEEDKVDHIFSKRGAYSRYKDLLDAKGMLQQWYDFENHREQLALLEWCKENDVDFMV